MPPTDRTAASARSSKSTRRILAASTSSSSGSRSGSEAEKRCGETPANDGAARGGGRSRARPLGRSCPRRVRRLRMPLLAAGVSRDRTGRTTTQRWPSLRLPALPADRHPPARARRGDRRRGGRAPRPLLGDAQTALLPASASKTTTAPLCRRARPDVQQFDQDRPTRAPRGGSVGTSRADWHPARCAAHRRCSSTAVVHRGGYDEATLLEELAR